MDKLFTREGVEFTGTPVLVKRSYWGDSYSPCNKCGGKGGSPHWYPDGGICYRCMGRNSMRHEYRKFRLFTAETLEKLNARVKEKEDARLYARECAAALYLANISEEVSAALAYAEEADYPLYVTAHARGLTPGEEQEVLERYAKHLRKVEEQARRERESRFLGEEGEKITFTATIVVNKPYAISVGYRRTAEGYFHVMTTDDKQTVVYAGSKSFPVGMKATFSATVKAQDFYEGGRQTKVTRPTLLHSEWFSTYAGFDRYLSEKVIARVLLDGDDKFVAQSENYTWVEGEEFCCEYGVFSSLEEAQEVAYNGARERLPAAKKPAKEKAVRTRKARKEPEEIDVSDLSFA